MLTGKEYLYSTPDGSFVFGGSPLNFDMIVGVRTGGSSSGLGGLYAEGVALRSPGSRSAPWEEEAPAEGYPCMLDFRSLPFFGV